MAGLVLVALTVLQEPVAMPRNLGIACAVFLVIGRGRPLDVMPVEYVQGWRDEEQRMRHRAGAARRERELLAGAVLLTIGVVGWIVAVLT